MHALTAALREARDRFPVWLNVWLAIGHAYTAYWLLEPARPTAFATLALPLSWAAAYYATLPREDRPSGATLAALALGAPVVALLWWLPACLADAGGGGDALRASFEILAPIWGLALAWHCLRHRGRAGLLTFFGLGFAYGLVLETSGISLGYFSESGYAVYVPFTPTPLSSVVGWCTIFYPSVYVAESIAARLAAGRRVVVPALLVTGVALGTDLHFDPVATALEMWTWHETLAPAWLGVPLVNFTSWFSALFAVSLVYFSVTTREWTPRGRRAAALLSVPVALALSAALNLLLIGLLEGFDGPSWRIFLAA